MTGDEIRRRLEIVGFGADDVKRVVALRDLIVRRAEEYTATFFDYLKTFEEASALINDGAIMESARRLKVAHVKAMAQGQYGPSYIQQRLDLGRLYATAELAPRVFLGAYHHLMQSIGFDVMEEYRDRPSLGFQNFMSLKKIAFFDVSLIVDVIVHQRERVIRQQQAEIRELSTPVMQIRDGLLMLPIIGAIDAERARQLTEDLLDAIRARRAKVVVMDVTGVHVAHAPLANHLVQTIQAARLVGATTIVAGLSSEVAGALVALGLDVGALNTAVDLQRGIEAAERMLGYAVAAPPAFVMKPSAS